MSQFKNYSAVVLVLAVVVVLVIVLVEEISSLSRVVNYYFLTNMTNVVCVLWLVVCLLRALQI